MTLRFLVGLLNFYYVDAIYEYGPVNNPNLKIPNKDAKLTDQIIDISPINSPPIWPTYKLIYKY